MVVEKKRETGGEIRKRLRGRVGSGLATCSALLFVIIFLAMVALLRSTAMQ